MEKAQQHGQTFRDDERQRAGGYAFSEDAVVPDVFEAHMKLLEHAGDAHEVDDVGLGDGAGHGERRIAHIEVFEVEAGRRLQFLAHTFVLPCVECWGERYEAAASGACCAPVPCSSPITPAECSASIRPVERPSQSPRISSVWAPRTGAPEATAAGVRERWRGLPNSRILPAI